MSTVSVIMNAFNAEKYLKETIDSVYAQTYSDWEIVFWDNASTDKTAEIVKQYDSKLHYFYSNEHVPLGKARNYALEKARGDYIAFLDCDDLWEPEKLDLQLKLLHERPDVKLVYSDGYIINSQGSLLEVFSEKYIFFRGFIFEKLMKQDFIPFQSVMMRRSLFERIYFSENFEVVEDLDMLLKVAYEYEIDYVPARLMKYRWHTENASHREVEAPIKEVIEIRKFWINKISDRGRNLFLRKLLSADYLTYSNWLLDQRREPEARKMIILSLFSPFTFSFKLSHLKYFLSFFPRKFSFFLLIIYRKLRSYCSGFGKMMPDS
ncbi:MAG: glycosyl transferase family protein [uncultured bacterium]|nr:MAG: glycosyl transferase family protein [uncultured bacterium]OGT14972.1 MAG: hypothetical protein A3B69_04520 [Gammaproteobacteria bacterium RIFCSPHIGHO2_02_FULL_38_33]OGT24138.1 MAG: hypothetical protein A2W47_01100 [Gammaproteobacteria bacterium RIFCSPHIGHO2_12_38_15]OGT67364.1 MAG: hypothetical protein A3I12_08205 [Gammaproteobacteria bacterium RIFCSPLOWO2_02_FULL_38_11]